MHSLLWLILTISVQPLAFADCERALLTIRASESGDYMELEGEPIAEYARSPLHSRGRNHFNMFRSHHQKRPVLLKQLNDRIDPEFRNSITGEIIGGPSIIGRALMRSTAGRKFQFLVIEELFPGEETITLQGLVDGDEALRHRGIEMLTQADRPNPLLRQLAHWVTRGFERDVLPPLDLDFIFTEHELRLIDAGGVTTGQMAKRSNWDRFYVHAILRIVARPLESILNREVSQGFQREFLAALRTLVHDEDRFQSLVRFAGEVYDDEGNYIARAIEAGNRSDEARAESSENLYEICLKSLKARIDVAQTQFELGTLELLTQDPRAARSAFLDARDSAQLAAIERDGWKSLPEGRPDSRKSDHQEGFLALSIKLQNLLAEIHRGLDLVGGE